MNGTIFNAPVKSVNNKTGTVSLIYPDIPGILPIERGGGSGASDVVTAANNMRSYFYEHINSSKYNLSISSSNSLRVDKTIYTHGRPVFLIASGDLNPLEATCWIQLYLIIDGTQVVYEICESHDSSNNNPFCIHYFTDLAAGNHTFSFQVNIGGGSGTLAESGGKHHPIFSGFEI